MTEREQLLRAILEEPWRDDVRLVYSDWLEDHGDNERADFIRVQCELAKPWTEDGGECWQCHCARTGKQHTNGPCRCSAVWKALRRRARDLLLDHNPKNAVPNVSNYSAWIDPFWKMFDASWDYQRGFVHGLRCKLADWFGEECRNQRHVTGGDDVEAGCPDCGGRGFIGAHGPAIATCHPVERVEFTDKEPGYRNNWYGWIRNDMNDIDHVYNLPVSIWRAFAGAEHGPWKDYPTSETATAALSNAAVNWARREAGLPELKFLQTGLASAGEGW